MLYYEDEEINVTGNSSDIKYDAGVMDSFTDALASDIDRYKERARALEREYVRYHNNETFVGQMAEDSKRFIYEVQGDKLHDKNIELKKEFLSLCLSVENKFKEEVDPSPKARVSVQTLSKIKKDFNVINNVADTAGYELDCCAKEVINIAGKWGVSTLPNFRRTVEALDEFCGHGKILDKDIRKLENYDREACAIIDRKDLTGYADDLQRNIKYTAGVLDSMTVYQPNMSKNSMEHVALTACAIWNPFKKFFGSSQNANLQKGPHYNHTDDEFIQSLKDQYGFSDEQAKLINDAYKKYDRQCAYSKKEKTNEQKMHEFFSNLAALNDGYGTNFDFSLDFEVKSSRPSEIIKDPSKIIEDTKENIDHNIKGNAQKITGNFTAFNMLGSNPSTSDAINFFYDLGVDGNELKEAINDQHHTCEENKKRDFVHECAILAVMSDEKNPVKGGADCFDDIDAAIGYKGDVYSGSMGIDDKMSDVEAYNLYFRMKEAGNGNIWDTMTEYNIGVENETINGSKEFLKHFGDGDAEIGMEELKKDLDKKTSTTYLLSRHTTEKAIEETKKDFLDYVSEQSGVDLN